MSYHVWIAVFAYETVRIRILRVQPCTGRDLDDAGLQIIVEFGSCQKFSPVIVNPNGITIFDFSHFRIIGIDAQRFAAIEFMSLAEGAMVQLRMQSRGWLIGNHVQHVAIDIIFTEPFGRRHPGWMARTVVIVVRFYGLREDFDFTAWCTQWIALRIFAERSKQNARIRRSVNTQLSISDEVIILRKLGAF